MTQECIRQQTSDCNERRQNPITHDPAICPARRNSHWRVNMQKEKEKEKPCPYHRQNQRKRWQEGEHRDHNRNVPISAEPVCATGASWTPLSVFHHLPLSLSFTTCPCPSLSPPAPVPDSHHLPLSQSLTTCPWDSHSAPTSAHSEGRELILTGCTQHVARSQLVTHMDLLPGHQCPHIHRHYCHAIRSKSVKDMTGKTLYSKILQSFLWYIKLTNWGQISSYLLCTEQAFLIDWIQQNFCFTDSKNVRYTSKCCQEEDASKNYAICCSLDFFFLSHRKQTMKHTLLVPQTQVTKDY